MVVQMATPSLTELLKKKVEQLPKYLSVTELPPRIEVKLLAFAFKTDKKGNEGAFITLETKEGAYIVQKYGKSCYEPLLDAMEAAGGEQYLRNNYHVWIMDKRGKSLNPRLYPIPLEKPKK
jgi:hypothetical protein